MLISSNIIYDEVEKLARVEKLISSYKSENLLRLVRIRYCYRQHQTVRFLWATVYMITTTTSYVYMYRRIQA